MDTLANMWRALESLHASPLIWIAWAGVVILAICSYIENKIDRRNK